MDIATVLSVAKTALTAIQTLEQLKETFSFSHYKDELERFQKTVNTVQSVLMDVDANQGPFNNQQTNYIEELKDVVYDATDVLDEFVTLVKRKQAAESSDKFSDKVRSFLSRFSHRLRNLSSKVKDINTKLDDIASDRSKFNFEFKAENKPINFVERETSSFVWVNDPIIGRDEDLEKIVEMLLGSDDVHQPSNVSSLAIVGMGGLGKTAFAQLVFNDSRITSAFQLRSWTCIADQDGWDLTQLLGKIVKDLSNQNLTSLEQMHREIRQQLEGKKYFLVLDDVWNESYVNWQELEKLLMVGESGSRIVVTTRSKKTAEIVCGVRVHELQGLSEDESWRLFERMAFRTEQIENLDEEFVKLGKDIVKKCFNVPLAIRVVGGLLHGVPKSDWLSFRDRELANISKSNGTMNQILCLSYYHLDSSLKSCFAYCAIFPKDFEINKEMLISLWMAQGYINEEYVGEKYFRILLQRCFFQDVKEDDMGEVLSFKIHDLLHDIAEQVSNEICRLNSDPINVDKKVRHLSLLDDFCPQETFNKAHIRTCHQVFETSEYIESWTRSSSDQLLVLNSIANWTSLRSLDLRNLSAKSLPKSISKLFHLRYLNLSCSKNLEVLPDSITKLVNLQTLELFNCEKLKELPKDMCKLVDLSTLNITNCYRLRHMPSKMGMLSNLHTLGLFVVGRASSYDKHCFDGLKDLGSLNNLKGALQIYINVYKNAKYVKEEHGGGAYLMNMVHLNEIEIDFVNRRYESVEWGKSLLEEMQPHDNIKRLILTGYRGETMPRWPRRGDNSILFYFPNLVKLFIIRCQHLQFVPSIEKLPHLKIISLCKLPNLEYVVNNNLEAPSLREGTSFFPCLEYINIKVLPKLKGWWPRSDEQNEDLIGEPFPIFAQLEDLLIEDCPMLKSIPICSRLTSVRLIYDSDRTMEVKDIDELPPNYKCLLPSESQSRMIALSYFETFLPNEANVTYSSE